MKLNPFLKRHLPLIGFVLSISMLLVAIMLYPGGSYVNPGASGFDWEHNYISNLFNNTGINGKPNKGLVWAVSGMLFFCSSVGWFFFSFSKKLPTKSAQLIVLFSGCFSMIFAFMAVTPFHDLMIRISSILSLISIFYCTVFLFKYNRYGLGLLSVFELLSLYCALYIYYTQDYLVFLPLVQKIIILGTIIWVLYINYQVSEKDFLTD